MPPTAREVMLREIDAWRAEDVITPELWATLRARYQVGGEGDPRTDLDDLPGTMAPGERARSAADWLQFVGGLLLGSAVVAFVAFAIGLNNADRVLPAVAMLVGSAIALAGAFALQRMRGEAKPGLVDAALAAALVPAAVAAAAGNSDGYHWIAWLALAPPLAAWALRRGRGPVVALATFGYAFAAFFTSSVPIFSGSDPASAFLTLGILAAYGALLLFRKGDAWTSVGLAILVAPLVLAFLSILNAYQVHGTGIPQLWIGAFLGILLGIGIWRGERGLVAGAAAGLTIDAVAFAADLGGALSALIVLAALGGLLVWQAEVVRAFFRRRAT